MNNPLRRFQRIADWLDDREATRKLRQLREEYSPLVEEAEKKSDWNERDRLLAEWQHEDETVSDPVYARQHEKLTAEARKYGISVPRRPTSWDEVSQDWSMSQVYGFWLLRNEPEQRLRREIRAEKRTSYDEFRKWATLGLAVLGFVLGLASILVKQKQPDPCARNYYRSDSGGCVFALPKNGTEQPQSQTTPAQVGNSEAPQRATRKKRVGRP